MTDRTHENLRSGIARLRGRWLRVKVMRYTVQSLFYILLCGAGALLVFPDVDKGVLALGLGAATLAVGLVLAVARRPNAAHLAKDLDDTAGYSDRVSSAVELVGVNGPMVDALREDAIDRTRGLTPARVYPMAVPREGLWMPVPVLLIAAVLGLQGWINAEPEPNKLLASTLEERIAQLEDMITEETGPQASERRKDLIAELEKLKQTLKPEETDKKDALAEVAKLLDQFEQEKQAEEEKKAELKKKLEELKPGEKNEDLEEALNNGDYSEALKKLREMMEELKEKKKNKDRELTPEELKELEELLKKLEEIEAQIMKMMQIDADLQMMGEVIEFLEAFEGDLADIEDFEIGDVLKLADLEPPAL